MKQASEIDLTGRSVLVTGGTGSFGREFVKSLLESSTPRRLVVYSRDEQKQYEMANEPPYVDHPGTMRFFIGDVRDQARLELAMRDIEVVIHAAALKHVPIAEYNPFECIHTNVLGAENVVQAALRAEVGRVVALSTDKAASPVNLYGASKLASDKIFVAANSLSGSVGTRFSVVRYGNVIGSRGRVVQLFQKLIADKADHLPITDARMTRFWITLKEGVDFVLSCLDLMAGGEIFVPKIPSMKITDLASALAPDLPQREIGIRPGEKLHEVMITEDDARTTIELVDRYVIKPAFPYWSSDFWSGEPYASLGAKQVPESFRYGSDTNESWMTSAELKAKIGSSI